jgi:23S rRNA (cytidine1920-2'-O)/16S rRNA (cytidine1409-2'-O)-methyltransferase
MSRKRRAPFVALVPLLAHHHPDLPDPAVAIAEARVLVDGRTVTNPNARVRRDARVVLRPQQRPLRGHTKLLAALDALRIDVTGATCLDVGAAAGGFTSALLERGAARVFALDAGVGQLAGSLRADDRVVNLERTNVSEIDDSLVPASIDVVTMDLSYLPVSRAVSQLEPARFADGARLIALVKPTFELGAGTVVTDAEAVRSAVRIAIEAIERGPWSAIAATLPAITGARGAIETFVVASRQPAVPPAP